MVILDSGRRNLGNGPDFLDARIRLEGIEMRGDVECHLQWEDWYRHGHSGDRRYRQTILHVVWQPPAGLPAALAKQFPHLVLSASLSLPLKSWLGEMQRLEDSGKEPVGGEIPAISPARLQSLAWQRFRRKCDEMQQRVYQGDWDSALYAGLACALGYRQNSIPFEQLMRQLPPQRLWALLHPLHRSPLLIWALLGWQSGLFERPLPAGFEPQKRSLNKILNEYSANLPYNRQTILNWQFSRVRPNNSPYLRLAGLAQLLYENQPVSLFTRLQRLLSARRPPGKVWPNLEDSLRPALSPAFQPYLCGLLGIRKIPSSAMGRQRARQVWANILLPLFTIWACYAGSSGFAAYLEDLYFCLPAAGESGLKFDRKNGQRRYAWQEQGLLEYRRRRTSTGKKTIDIPRPASYYFKEAAAAAGSTFHPNTYTGAEHVV